MEISGLNHEELLTFLVAVMVLGISAQWIAWRLNLPSILLLLIFGIVAGVSRFIDPDLILGNILLPFVSLSVALILYEGGLTLRLKEVQKVGGVVRNLVTVGALATWVFSSLAAYWLFDISAIFAALVGSIFIVTGPTVIGPMLRHVRPRGSVGPILKWEGIVTDPIGAMLAVILFNVMVTGADADATTLTSVGALKTLFCGGVVGCFGAYLLWQLLANHLVPDFLQNPLSLMLVLMVFAAGNILQHEAGLVGVTLMGILLANQRSAPVGHIIEFKENLRVLLISVLFILLAARLDPQVLKSLDWRHFAFVATLIFAIRPACVFLSTFGTTLTWRERVFLCCVAPRGIVAAAVASVLSLELQKSHPEAELLVPLTFLVIISTVTIYGLGAAPIARWLGLSRPSSEGFLILGAHPWARAMALTLQGQGSPVLLVDSNPRNAMQAKMAGLPVWQGNLLADHALDEIDLAGLGHLLALTPNDEVNALACHHLEDVFGRSHVFQLVVEEGSGKEMSVQMGGRRLFQEGITFQSLDAMRERGGIFKVKVAGADGEAEQPEYGPDAAPLFVINDAGAVRVLTTGGKAPAAGHKVISMVVPQETVWTEDAEKEVLA